MKIVLFLLLALFCPLTVHSELIISEVILDDDGNFAALPYKSSGSVAISTRTVMVDPIVELTNTGAGAVNIQGYSIWYVIETKVDTHPHPNAAAFDLAGLKPNFAGIADSHVVSRTIRIGMCSERRPGIYAIGDGTDAYNIGAGGVVALYTNPHRTQIKETTAFQNHDFPGLASGTTECRFDNAGVENDSRIGFSLAIQPDTAPAEALLGGNRHSYPTAGGTYPNVSGTVAYYRIFLPRPNGGPGGLASPADVHLGWEGTVDSRKMDANAYSESISVHHNTNYGENGIPRILLGNEFVSASQTWQGDAVGPHRFAILLVNSAGEIADAFYLGEGSGWQGLDDFIAVAPKIGGYNFTTVGQPNLNMYSQAELTEKGASYTSLHLVGYNKTDLSPAVNPGAYVKSLAGLGSDDTGEVDPGELGGTDVLGPVYSQCLRTPPDAEWTTTIAPQPDINIGDQFATFEIEVSAKTDSDTAVDSVQISLRSSPGDPFGSWLTLTKDPADSFRFTGTFVPKASTPALADVKTWDVKVKSTTNLVGTTQIFTGIFQTENAPPVIGNATFSPNIVVGEGTTTLAKGEAITLSVQAEDVGTSVLEYVQAILWDHTGGAAVGTPIDMTTTDKKNYTVTTSIPTSLTPGSLYYWIFRAKDPWNAYAEKSFDTKKFQIENKPYFDASLPVVNVLINTTESLEIRGYTRADAPYNPDDVTYSLVSYTANLTNCVLRAGAGTMYYLDITAGSVAGTAACTLDLTVGTPAVTNRQTVLVNILPDTNTVLEHLKLAPSPFSIAPTNYKTWTNISFDDYLEVEIKLSDIDGLGGAGSSVKLAFVVTDPALIAPMAEMTAYEVLLFDDGQDFRSPKTAPFGQYKISTPPPYTYPLLTALPKDTATPSGLWSVPSNGASADFRSFKADLNGASDDDTYHITIQPYNFQFATEFRLDITVVDDAGDTMTFPAAGKVGVYNGPGYTEHASCFISRWETSVPFDYEGFNMNKCECDGPPSVSQRKCGDELSAAEHDSLYWEVVSYDTDFYNDVRPFVSPPEDNTADIIEFKLKSYSCNDGVRSNGGWINLSVTDARGVPVTTNSFFPEILCINDAPSYTTVPPAEITTLEDTAISDWWIIPILNYANEFSLYGETAQASLKWTLHTSSDVWSAPKIAEVTITGTNLKIKLAADAFHSGADRDNLVLCVQDGAGLYPANGAVAGPGGVANACIVQSVYITAADDPLLISKDGTSALPPIGVQIGVEDTPHTTTVGIYDIDGPYGAANVDWYYTIDSDPENIISSINFTYSAAVSEGGTQVGEVWNMNMTPNANRNGMATVWVSVSNYTGTTATELVTYYLVNTNDTPAFSSAPCALIETSEGFPSPLVSALDFAVVTDADLDNSGGITIPAVPGVINPSDTLNWSLQEIQYSGYVLESVSGEENMTPAAGTVTFAPTVTTQQTIGAYNAGGISSNGFVKILASGGPNNNGQISLESIPYAYGDATVVVQITDTAGDLALYSCPLKINLVNHPPVIDADILTFNRVFDEDTTYVVDLGAYEKDPYNFGAFDADLRWSVRLKTPTTLFDFPVNYPAFADFLNTGNTADGLHNLITVGNQSGVAGSGVATPGDTPRDFADPNDDRLYLRAAPDMYGEFEIELFLHRLNLSTLPSPATRVLTFTIDPLNDLPAITVLNEAGTGEELAYTFTLSKTDSVAYLDLTSWENDARDFFGPKAGNNPADNFYWRTDDIVSKDNNVYRLGCPSTGQKFLDSTTNDILCIKPGSAVLYSSLEEDLELIALDKDSGTVVKRIVRVRIMGENTPPWTVDLGTGADRLVFPEDSVNYEYDLLPHSMDEEETANNSRKLMTWVFAAADVEGATTSPNLADIGFGPDFATFSIDNTPDGPKLLVNSNSYMNGSTTVWMRLCDTGIPHGPEEAICVSTQVTLEVTAVNNSPSVSAIPSTTLTGIEGAVGMAPPGGCLRIPLAAYGSDPDDIYPGDPHSNGATFPSTLVWQVKGGSVALTGDGFVAAPAMPVATVTGVPGNQELLVAFSTVSAPNPFVDNTCNQGEGAIGSEAARAYGSVNFTLVVSDVWGLKAERASTAVFEPRWTSPVINPASAFFVLDGQGNWGWSIAESDASTTISLELTAPAGLIMMSDSDWGYGEDMDDFGWTLFSLDSPLLSPDSEHDLFYSTNYLSWETAGFNCVLSSDMTWFATREFQLEVLRPGPGLSDQLRLTPYGYVHTTGVTLTLTVTDSQGLMDMVTVKVVVADVNDSPLISQLPRIDVMEDNTRDFNLSPYATDDIDLDVIEWGFWDETDCSLKNIARTTFDAVINGANLLSVTGRANMFHTSSVPYGETVTLCLKDRPGAVDSIIITTEVAVYIYGLNDPPHIVLPAAGLWPGGVNRVIRHEEDQKTCVFIQGHDFTDTLDTNWRDYLSWQITPISANYQIVVSSDNSHICVESVLPHFNKVPQENYTLTLRDAGRWSSYDGTDQTSSITFSVWTQAANDAPVLANRNDGSNELSLVYTEDFSGSIGLADYISISDPDWGYGVPHDPGTYRWSFSDANSNMQVYNNVGVLNAMEIPEWRYLDFAFTDFEFSCTSPCNASVPRLSWLTDEEETNGNLSFTIYLHDVTGGASGLVRPFQLNFDFTPVADPPRFTAAAATPVYGDGSYFKLKKNNATPLSVDISTWKEDPDTASNKVCFGIHSYSPKLHVSFPTPPGYSSPNCSSDQEILQIFPALNAIGDASFTLSLQDTDGNMIYRNFPVRIFDPVPQFVAAHLSAAELNFTSPGEKVILLDDLITDDENIESGGFSILGGPQDIELFSAECSIYKNCKIGDVIFNGLNSLTIRPDYGLFSEGSAAFTLNYVDLEGRTASITATMTKQMSFLEWAKFDDVDGDGSRSRGDRILLKFSDSSGGMVGLTNTVPVVGSLAAYALSTDNVSEGIKPLKYGVEQEDGFGGIEQLYAAKKIDCFGTGFSPLAACSNGALYVQITLNDGFRSGIDAIGSSHSASGVNTRALVYKNGLRGYDRVVPVSGSDALPTTTDDVSPRLMAAYLVDINGDAKYLVSDQIRIYFSEIIAPLVNSGAQNWIYDYFTFSDVNLGTDYRVEQSRNEIRITLGTNGQVSISHNPRVAGKSSIVDKAGKTLGNADIYFQFRQNDDIGPWISGIRYDNREGGNYSQGDKIYISFSEPLHGDTVNQLNNSALLPGLLGLSGGAFGVGSTVEWSSSGELVISLGSNPAVDGTTSLLLSSGVRDIGDNAAGANSALADFGVRLPVADNFPPYIVLRFYKDGLELTGDALNNVGTGTLSIQAAFSTTPVVDPPELAPRIVISSRIRTMVSTRMNLLPSDYGVAPNTKYGYEFTIGTSDGLNSFDGTHTVTFAAVVPDNSGLSLEQPQNNVFVIDTRAPVVQLLPYGTEVQGGLLQQVDVDYVDIYGYTDEIMNSFTAQLVSPSSGPSIVPILKTSKRDFEVRLRGLRAGENIIKVIVTDKAGNVTERIERIFYSSSGDTPYVYYDPNDRDDDGVPNHLDAFPDDPNEWLDTDGDGTGDNADTDADGDWIPNDDDYTMFRGQRIDLSLDSDNDGIPNRFDLDADGDGLVDFDKVTDSSLYRESELDTRLLDTDNNGVANRLDEDMDGDGLTNLQEFNRGTNPFNKDTDGDGVSDFQDINPLDPTCSAGADECLGYLYYAMETDDWDRDGVQNIMDSMAFDYSGDGVPDVLTDDWDGDGVPNADDYVMVVILTDYDGDGIPNEQDPYPCNALNNGTHNTDGTPRYNFIGTRSVFLSLTFDYDNDCLPDYMDPDKSGNGIPNELESMVEKPSGATGSETKVAVPRDVNGDFMVRLPLSEGEEEAELEADVYYDFSRLDDSYSGLESAKLPASPSIVEVVPTVAVYNAPQISGNLSKPAGYNTVGKVISIRGKIKPGMVASFPFPLPTYFANNRTVWRHGDFKVQYYRESDDANERGWVDGGRTTELNGAVLYAEVGHFSDWRVLVKEDPSQAENDSGGESALPTAGSAAGGGGGGGCFVVTAASGGREHFLVRYFEAFRDEFLYDYAWGRSFMEHYYHFSPPWAEIISASLFLRSLVFCLLLVLVPVSFVVWYWNWFLVGVLLLCGCFFLRHSRLFKVGSCK